MNENYCSLTELLLNVTFKQSDVSFPAKSRKPHDDTLIGSTFIHINRRLSNCLVRFSEAMTVTSTARPEMKPASR